MRTVVITGCSSGIGFEAALAFAAAGDRVVATIRDMGRSDRLRSAASEHGLELDIAELDVARPDLFATFVDAAVDRHGGIDVLVNNAGVLPVGAFEDVSEAELRSTMEVDFFGPALLTRAVLPHMRARNRGHVIMVSSLSGLAGRAGDAAYSASKFALEGLTEALRQEVLRWNIRVSLVEPAGCATNLFGRADAHKESPYAPLIAAQQADMHRSLAEGAAEPADLARLIVGISRSGDPRLRWPADPVAEQVLARLLVGDDESRRRFLDDVAGVGWWINGEDAPPEA